MFLSGSQMVHGTVKACKSYKNCNPIGQWLDNPILDICLYDIEFQHGEVTPNATNAILQAMYAQCSMDGNEYLVLEWFVHIQKDLTAMCLYYCPQQRENVDFIGS